MNRIAQIVLAAAAVLATGATGVAQVIVEYTYDAPRVTGSCSSITGSGM
jgi:hypothetical protein